MLSHSTYVLVHKYAKIASLTVTRQKHTITNIDGALTHG
jgi:hypothetical protein